ncbi:MAG: alpha/beta hydrolase [Planctomycetota bacterium]
MSDSTTTKPARPLWVRLLRSATRVVLGLVVLLPAIVWLFGRTYIYHPTHTPLAARRALASRPQWSEHSLTANGQTLVGMRRAPLAGGAATSTAATWAVFWGGNAASIDANVHIMDIVRGKLDLGIDVHAYRGYDESTGSPSEAGILSDAREQLAALMRDESVTADRLVLIGQSLGTGVALRLAAELCTAGTPPAAVVAVSPYTSMSNVFDDTLRVPLVGWALVDSWRSDAAVGAITCPVLLIHGGADTLIRPWHSQRLAAMLGERATLKLVPRCGHNDIWEEATIREVHAVLAAHAR